MISLLFPRLKEMGGRSGPRAFTAGRQAALVATLTIVLGVPIALHLRDAVLQNRAPAAILAMREDAEILAALARQNAAPLAQPAIDAIDRDWIAERRSSAGRLHAAMLATPASEALRRHVRASWGGVSHAIVSDMQGRNVAIAAPTTDYWQGDEAKHLAVFAASGPMLHLGRPEARHDGKGAACWRSEAIVADGVRIGVLSVELDVARLGSGVCRLD
jgi:hypothetical protein